MAGIQNRKLLAHQERKERVGKIQHRSGLPSASQNQKKGSKKTVPKSPGKNSIFQRYGLTHSFSNFCQFLYLFSHLLIDLLAILGKNLNRTMLCCSLKNFRTCTISIEGITPLDRTFCIKMYVNNARSRLFWRIAKRSIDQLIPPGGGSKYGVCNFLGCLLSRRK